MRPTKNWRALLAQSLRRRVCTSLGSEAHAGAAGAGPPAAMEEAVQDAVPAGRAASVNRWTPLVAGMYLELCGGSALR